MEVSKSREKRKYLTHKGQDGWQLFSKSKADLNPDDAPIREADNGNGYVQNFLEVSGYIDDVIVQLRWMPKADGGKKPVDIIDIHFESGGELIILQLRFDMASGESFAKKFRNINVKKKVSLMAGQGKAKPGQKYGQTWLAISYGSPYDKEDSIPVFYSKEYTDKKGLKFTTESRHGGSEFDKKAYMNWLYGQFIQDVHEAFGHYEEKPQEEPSERDSSRDSRRDDNDRGSDRNSSRISNRNSRRDDDDDDDRGRNSERGRGSERDSGRDSRREDEGRGRKEEDRGRGSDRNARKDDDEDRGGGRNTRSEDSERNYRSRDDNSRSSGREEPDSRRTSGRDDDDDDRGNETADDLPF